MSDKKTLCSLLVVGLVLVVSVGGFLWLTNREKLLARQVALKAVQQVLSEKDERKKAGIPLHAELLSEKPADTDLFDRRWDVWFELQPSGSVLVTVSAPRGIYFIPLFNLRDDLFVSRIEYAP